MGQAAGKTHPAPKETHKLDTVLRDNQQQGTCFDEGRSNVSAPFFEKGAPLTIALV